MKKNVLSCCLALILGTALYAQENEKAPVAYKKSLTAKFAPAGLALGKITVGAEFNFKRKQSITLLLGIPYDKKNTVTYDDKSSDITSSGRSAMLGYRYYLGKKGRSGFYAEPYLKYVKFKADGLLNADLNGSAARFDSHFNYEGYGAGVQIGFQFYIARVVAVDFFLLGPEANSAKFSSAATDVYDNIPWSLADGQEAEKDIKDNLEKIPFLGDKIDVTVDTNAKTVYTKFTGFLPGFRAGLSLGIRF
ncbi:MAG: DUF3575 domain-containing protein [Chitinophagaceae bacterium]